MSAGLQFDIQMRPDFSVLKVNLQPGQKVFAEPSAMVAMSPGLKLQAGLKGGALRSLGRLLGRKV
jgi:uncharacterized protein (AIM24 family)